MLSNNDRAPDSTATVPRGNEAGSRSASESGIGSKVSESGNGVFDGMAPRLRLSSRTGPLPGHLRHLAAQVFYLFSAV